MKIIIASIMMFAASTSAFAACQPSMTRSEVKAEMVAFKKLFPLSGKTELGYPTDSMPAFVSTTTRAEVKAEMVAFKKQYPNQVGEEGFPANVQPKPTSTATRSEVKEELKDAKDAGLIPFGEEQPVIVLKDCK